MAWYYGTYSCGHEGRVNIIGPTKDRQRKSDWHFSGLCPECYKKQLEEERAAANKEAAEKSAEMELPELSGTEKQVAWANTLRVKVIERYEAILEKSGDKASKSRREEIVSCMDYAIKVHTDAKFWIESRDNSNIFRDFMKEYKEHKEKEVVPTDVAEEIEQEEQALTVVPDTEQKKSGVVVISNKDSVLFAAYPKDEKFREIVKLLGFKWNGVTWYKEITEYTGSQEERAAELGNKLLLAGFTVRFPNTVSKDMGVSGKFSAENDRWVKFNAKIGKLALVWEKRSNTLYEAARKLPGAKWSNGSMKVNIAFCNEVLDFAETMGFSISQKAQSEIEKYKEKEAAFEKAKATPHKDEAIEDKERLEKTLKSGATILEDLQDD